MSSEETPSVADTLREAFEAGEQSEEKTEEVTEENTEENEVSEETEESVAQEESSDSVLTAPQHWSEEDRTMFDGQTDEAKQFLLDRHKSMEADYTKKTQEISELRKVFDPFKEQFEAAGLSEPDGVRLVSDFFSVYSPYVQALQSDPETAIKQLAADYGVNLTGEEDYTDPEVKSLKEEIKQLKQQIGNTQSNIAQSNTRSVQQEIDRFKATEIDGKPAYPHYARLEGAMSALIQSGQVRGVDHQDTLKKAYEKALRLDDDLYNESIEQKHREVMEEEKRKKQEAAKAAKTRVTPKGKSIPETEEDEPGSIRDELMKAYQEAQA